MSEDIKWNKEQQFFLKDLVNRILLCFHHQHLIGDFPAWCFYPYCHRIRCPAVMPQIQDCRVGKLHGKSPLYNLSGIQCNLRIILEHSDDHLIVRGALTFQMVFLFSYSNYLKTGIRYFLFCTGILSLDKVFIGIKEYFFISPVIFSKHFIDHRNDQTAAVIQQRPEYIIVWCTRACRLSIAHSIPPYLASDKNRGRQDKRISVVNDCIRK